MSQPFHYQVNVDYRSEKGKRRNNEDYAEFFEPAEPEELRKSGRLYVVADGVGGASEGEKASQHATKNVLHRYYNDPDPDLGGRLQRALQQAGNDIYDHVQRKGPGLQMGTTLVAAALHEDRVIIANVGDSRAYLIRNGVAQQITVDHTTAGMLLRDGEISEEEALNFRGKNQLTRSLGSEYDVRVDVFEEQLQPGDRLLLCSDGLARYTLSAKIAQLASSGAPEQVVERCVRFAYSKGAVDNVTVMVIEIGQPVYDLATTLVSRSRPHLPPVKTLDEFATDPLPPTVRASRVGLLGSRIRVPLFVAGVAILLTGIVIGGLFFSLGREREQEAAGEGDLAEITETAPTVAELEPQPTTTPEPEPDSVAVPPMDSQAESCQVTTLVTVNLRTAPIIDPAYVLLDVGADITLPVIGFMFVDGSSKWWRVRYNDQEGWMSSSPNYVQISGDCDAVPEITPTPTASPEPPPTVATTATTNPRWEDGRCLYTAQSGDNASKIINYFIKANPGAGFEALYTKENLEAGLLLVDEESGMTIGDDISIGQILRVVFIEDETQCVINIPEP